MGRTSRKGKHCFTEYFGGTHCKDCKRPLNIFVENTVRIGYDSNTGTAMYRSYFGIRPASGPLEEEVAVAMTQQQAPVQFPPRHPRILELLDRVCEEARAAGFEEWEQQLWLLHRLIRLRMYFAVLLCFSSLL